MSRYEAEERKEIQMEKNGKKKAKHGGTPNFRLRMLAPEVTISRSFPVATSVMRNGTTTIVSSTQCTGCAGARDHFR